MAELPKRYDPTAVEPKWYQRWLENRDFVANPESSKPAFSIVMPPPNITGMLTLGHVLNDTIQDILARRARMQGFEVLWLPGMDHAGIGTQTAVGKRIRCHVDDAHDERALAERQDLPVGQPHVEDRPSGNFHGLTGAITPG